MNRRDLGEEVLRIAVEHHAADLDRHHLDLQPPLGRVAVVDEVVSENSSLAAGIPESVVVVGRV